MLHWGRAAKPVRTGVITAIPIPIASIGGPRRPTFPKSRRISLRILSLELRGVGRFFRNGGAKLCRTPCICKNLVACCDIRHICDFVTLLLQPSPVRSDQTFARQRQCGRAVGSPRRVRRGCGLVLRSGKQPRPYWTRREGRGAFRPLLL